MVVEARAEAKKEAVKETPKEVAATGLYTDGTPVPAAEVPTAFAAPLKAVTSPAGVVELAWEADTFTPVGIKRMPYRRRVGRPHITGEYTDPLGSAVYALLLQQEKLLAAHLRVLAEKTQLMKDLDAALKDQALLQKRLEVLDKKAKG